MDYSSIIHNGSWHSILTTDEEITFPHISCLENDIRRFTFPKLPQWMQHVSRWTEKKRVDDCSNDQHGGPCFLITLPTDIILHLLDLAILGKSDLAALSSTCSRMATLVTPILYRSLFLSFRRDRPRGSDLLQDRLLSDAKICSLVRRCSTAYDGDDAEGTIRSLLVKMEKLNSLKLSGSKRVMAHDSFNLHFSSLSFLNLDYDCPLSTLPTILSLSSLETLYIKDIFVSRSCRDQDTTSRAIGMRHTSRLSSMHISRWTLIHGFQELIAIPRYLREFSANFTCVMRRESPSPEPIAKVMESQRTSLEKLSITLQCYSTGTVQDTRLSHSIRSSFSEFTNLRHLEIDLALLKPVLGSECHSPHEGLASPSSVLPQNLQSLKVGLPTRRDCVM